MFVCGILRYNSLMLGSPDNRPRPEKTMSKSTRLRSEDWHAILRLVGECRDLGDDRAAWRHHVLAQLCGLVGADSGFCAEMAGFRAARPTDVGSVDWGLTDRVDPAVQAEQRDMVEREPSLYGAILAYFQRLAWDEGACHSRREIIPDRDWYPSTSYQLVHRPIDADHVLWCYRSIPGTAGDVFSGLILFRAIGRRDYCGRDVAIVREAQAALTSLIGGPLARFVDPSPADLAPRVRQVLACLLEGDGDKQIARRLGLSPYTVNQYTKALFRHFGVSGRTELMARWVRRGWASRPPWLETGASAKT